jgi:all-trans-retinol dehydrogenase (NAD+)
MKTQLKRFWSLSKVQERIGDVTILINNAGIMPCHQFLSHNPREVTRAFEVNVYGPLWLIREFLPRMIERRKGHIVTICSGAGLVGSRNLVAYAATKHAINGAVESLREELRFHSDKPKIQFTTVYPTPCNTSFSKNVIYSRYEKVFCSNQSSDSIFA